MNILESHQMTNEEKPRGKVYIPLHRAFLTRNCFPENRSLREVCERFAKAYDPYPELEAEVTAHREKPEERILKLTARFDDINEFYIDLRRKDAGPSFEGECLYIDYKGIDLRGSFDGVLCQLHLPMHLESESRTYVNFGKLVTLKSKSKTRDLGEWKRTTLYFEGPNKNSVVIVDRRQNCRLEVNTSL